jgi:hypothetical protein
MIQEMLCASATRLQERETCGKFSVALKRYIEELTQFHSGIWNPRASQQRLKI